MAYRRYFGDTYTYGAAIIKYGNPNYMFLNTRQEQSLRRNLATTAKHGRPTVLKLMSRPSWKEEHLLELMMEDW